MKIVIVSVGRIKKGYLREGFDDYILRVRRYAPVEIVEVRDEPASGKRPIEDVLKEEARRITRCLKQGDFIAALSEKGSMFTSREFSEFMERVGLGGRRRLCFIVGGAYGLHPGLVEGADASVSLSAMTLPHELARLVLAEQVYRALAISRGSPYSH